MNILHVVNIYFVLPYFIGDQFKYFKEKGYNMNVVCSRSEYLASYAKEQGFDYIESPVNRSISLKDDFVTIWKICRFIKKKKIDIVVGHTPKGGLLAMISAWIMRVPNRIYFRHGLVYETSQGLKRFILMSVDRLTSLCATKIVCVSPSLLKKSIEDKLAPAKKQVILGHGTCGGIDTINKFNPEKVDLQKVSDLRKRLGINIQDYIIGYSGRLVRDKGIVDLINAFDLLDNSENCKLLFVGMFEDRDALPETVRTRIENDPRIIYTGFVNGGMEYYYALMDVYILPSYREGFGMGLLEAQAMERPVLTTKVTGCCDAIVEGETGLFVSHDPQDIANKINSIRFRHLIDGRNGRKWVMKYFDNRIIWNEIEKLYQ